MTLLAGGFPVHSRERITCLRVVEPGGIDLRLLPVDRGVALRATGSKAALVRILMAGAALRRKAHPGVIQVFLRQGSAGRSGDMLRRVAGAATQGRMLAFEPVARCAVVEPLHRRGPVEHVEAFAVMVGMALHARRARRTRLRVCRVQASMLLNLDRDLAMTVETAELRRARRYGVAFGAIRRPIQALMRSG